MERHKPRARHRQLKQSSCLATVSKRRVQENADACCLAAQLLTCQQGWQGDELQHGKRSNAVSRPEEPNNGLARQHPLRISSGLFYGLCFVHTHSLGRLIRGLSIVVL